MQKKNVLLMVKIMVIALIAIFAFGAASVLAANSEEKVISETTKLKWKNEILDYELNLTNFRIIYTIREYRVEHYKEKVDGTYELVTADTEIKSGIVGEYGEYEPNDYIGFVYNPALTTPENKAILIDGNLIIKLNYERRKDLTYTVNHYYEDEDGDLVPALYEQRIYGNQIYGDEITNSKVELLIKNGYRYGRTENTPLIIDINEANNVIDVYYYKSNVVFEKTSKAYSGIDESPIADTEEFIHEGDYIIYTILVKNLGKSGEQDIEVVVTDVLDLRLLELISSYAQDKGTLTESDVNGGMGKEVKWVGDLASLEEVTIEIKVKIKAVAGEPNGFVIEKNVATTKIDGEDGPDVEDGEEYEVGKVNIVGEKSSIAYGRNGLPVSGNELLEEDTIIYTITLTNLGNEAGNAKVTDPLFIDALEYINDTPSKGTTEYNPATGILTWQVNIDAKETVTLVIETKVKLLEEELEIHNNIAKLEVNDEEEEDIPDDEEYYVRKPEVIKSKTSVVYDYTGTLVQKVGNPTTIHEGDTIVYTITLENRREEADKVSIVDTIQIGALEEVSISASLGTVQYNAATGLLTWEEIIPGHTTVTITITAKTKKVATGASYTIEKNIVDLTVNEIPQDPIIDDDEYIVAKTDVTVAKSSTLKDYLGEFITDTNDCHEGDIITYTIIATNNGIAEEKGIVITDDINIARLTYVSASSNKTPNPVWNAGTGRLTWTGDLAPGASVIITITVEVKQLPAGVTSLQIGQNTVGIKANGEDRPEIKDPRDYWVRKSNVITEKSSVAYNAKDGLPISSGEFIHEGDTIVYVITINNAGAIREKGLKVVDPINTELLDFIGVTRAPGIGTVSWNDTLRQVEWEGTLLPGETVTIMIAVQVKETDSDVGYAITKNIATIKVNGGDEEDIEDPEEYVVGKITLNTQKTSIVRDYNGVEIEKTTPMIIHERSTITYTIFIENIGDETANIVVEDPIQTDLVSYKSSSSSIGANPVWNASAKTVTWTGEVIGGGNVTITIEVEVKDVVSGASYTIENNVAKLEVNGEEDEDIPDDEEYIVAKTEIEVIKSSTLKDYLGEFITDTNDCHEGDEITYTITVTNKGLLEEKGVVITDDINIALVQHISSSVVDSSTEEPRETLNWNGTTGRLTWTGDLEPEESITITITVKVLPLGAGVTSAQIGQNTIKIYANGEDKEDVKDPRDYWVRKSNVIAEKSSVAYRSSNWTPIPATAEYISEGDYIIYTIKVTNEGAIKEKDIRIEDPINTVLLEFIGVIVVEDIGEAIWNDAGGIDQVEWVGTLNPDETATIKITVKVKETDGASGYVIGQNIASIQVQGGDEEPVIDPDEYNVEKVDLYTFKTSKAFDYSGEEVPTEGNFTIIHEGDTIVYSIIIENRADVPVDIAIEDPIQTSLVEYQTCNASIGAAPVWNAGAGTVSWSGTVPANGSVEILITVKALEVPVGEESYILERNIASLEVNSVEAEPIKDDNEYYVVTKLNVTAEKSSTLKDYLGEFITDTDDCHEGDTITYEITVTNNSTIITERNVTITDEINITALEYKSSSATKGTPSWDGDTGIITWIGELSPEESVTITITVEVKPIPAGQTYVVIGQNIAVLKVNGEEEDVEDPRDYTVRKSNVYTERTSKAYAAGTGTEILAPNFVHEGDTIVYSITVRNDGSIREKGILITDPLVNTAYIQRISESVSPNIGTVSWNSSQNRFEWLGTLNPGQSVTITFTVQVRSVPSQPDGFIIGANVATRRVNGQNDGTITDPRTYTVGKMNLSASKTSEHKDASGVVTASNDIYENETITFTITIRNTGNEAGPVLVTDTIPTWLTFVSSPDITSTEFALLRTTGLTVTVPAAVGATPGQKTITFTVAVGDVATGTSFRNSVTAGGATGQDSRTYTKRAATVSVTKSSSHSVTELNVGDEIIYTIRVQLTAGNVARNIVVKDAIPAGTTVVNLMDATRIEGTDVIFEIGNITGNGTYVDVSFKVAVTQNNKNNSTSNTANITNQASTTGNNVTGTVNSNTVNDPLERYTNVPVNKKLWEGEETNVIDYRASLDTINNIAPGSQITTNALSTTGEVIGTIIVELGPQSGGGAKPLYITCTLNPGVTIDVFECVYFPKLANYASYAEARADATGTILTIIPDGTKHAFTVPSITGNNQFYIGGTGIHIDRFIIGVVYNEIPVPASTFKANISGTTVNGQSYSNTITIPAGGQTSFTNVPYGTYTVTELDMSNNVISEYDVIISSTNLGKPTEGYSTNTSLSGITVGQTVPTIYIDNIIPWEGELSGTVTKVELSGSRGKIIQTAQSGLEIEFKSEEGRTSIIAKDEKSEIQEIKYCWTVENTEPDEEEWITYEEAVQYEGTSKGTIYLWAKALSADGNSIVDVKTFEPISAPKIESQLQFINEEPSFKILGNGNAEDVRYLYRINEEEWNFASKNVLINIGDTTPRDINVTVVAFDNAGRLSQETIETLTVIEIDRSKNTEMNDGTIIEGPIPQLGVDSIVIGIIVITGSILLTIFTIKRRKEMY